MTTFFEKSDFVSYNVCDGAGKIQSELIAGIANDKLKRDGRVVYGSNNDRDWSFNKFEGDTHQALLICIEEIKKCDHPKEKIFARESGKPSRLTLSGMSVDSCIQYYCECGTRVEPAGFREYK